MNQLELLEAEVIKLRKLTPIKEASCKRKRGTLSVAFAEKDLHDHLTLVAHYERRINNLRKVLK